MRLVVDANVLLSGIVRDSLTRRLLLDERLELFAPRHLLEEVERHVLHDGDIRRKTQLGVDELKTIFEYLLEPIKAVPVGEQESGKYERNLASALKLATHPEDAPYLATAMTLGCPIWSNDSDFSRQKKVPVISTAKLAETMAQSR